MSNLLSGPRQPYDKSTTYVDELSGDLDELALRGRRCTHYGNVNYIATCVQKHPSRLMGFSKTHPRREKVSIEKLMRNEEEIQLNITQATSNGEILASQTSIFTGFFQKRLEPNLRYSSHTCDASPSFQLIETAAKKHLKLSIMLGHLKEGGNAHAEALCTIPRFINMLTYIDSDLLWFGSGCTPLSPPSAYGSSKGGTYPNLPQDNVLSGFSCLIWCRNS